MLKFYKISSVLITIGAGDIDKWVVEINNYIDSFGIIRLWKNKGKQEKYSLQVNHHT